MSSPNGIRALSIAGPFAYLLATGHKTIELRSWKTQYRGLVLLHTSTSRDWDWAYEWVNFEPSDCPKAAIQGAATLVNCIEYKNARQWERDLEAHKWLGDESYAEIRQNYYGGKPPIGHVFENPTLIDPPILDVPGAYQYWLPRKQKQIQAFDLAVASLNEREVPA